MTDLRTAAQQALEALFEINWSNNSQWQSKRAESVIPALRAALAEEALQRLSDVHQEIEAALEQPEQEQEPVAWMYKGIKSDGTEHGPHLVWVPAYMDAMSAAKGVVASPLYTHPPRRETEPAAFDALVAISLLTHLGGEVAEYADVVEAVRRLHALNGELLEALKWIATVNAMDYEYQAKARIAIARAEGEV
jgi:hypothetical protein